MRLRIASRPPRHGPPGRPRVTGAALLAGLLATAAMPARPAAAQDASAAVAARARGELRGRVFDSTTSAPLADAVVQLVSATDVREARTVRSDASGRFAFSGVASGRYLIGFVHPRLRAVLIEPPVRELTVADGDTTVSLAVPSGEAIARAACGDPARREHSTPILGRVTAADGAPLLAPARVTVTWAEITIDRGLRTTWPSLVAETDAAGIYRLCGTPANTNVRLAAVAGRASTGAIDLTTPGDGLLLQDLAIGASERVPLADDAPDVTVLRGPGQLTGRIVTRADSSVVRARVRLAGTAGTALTDSAGTFRLTGLPTGTHTLEAFAIGYTPTREIVHVGEGALADTEARLRLTLERADPRLDTVRVFATADPFDWRTEFADRRSRGLGRFIDEAMIARRNPQRTSELLDLLPELGIRRARSMAEEQLFMRDASGNECLPDLFIDGRRFFLDAANIDGYVAAFDLAGVEVYRSQALRPLRFVTENPCGAIVLWTGRRGRSAPG